MSETITLGKSRKTGDWIVLVQPEKQFGEHLNVYRKIAATAPVSDEYSRVVTGKIRHTSPALTLITSEQKKAAVKADDDRMKSIKEIVGSADKRQSDMAAEAAAEKQEEHEKLIEEKNKEINKIRAGSGQEVPKPSGKKSE